MSEQDEAEIVQHILANEQKCQVCAKWKPERDFVLETHTYGGSIHRYTFRACAECRERADRWFH